MRKQHEWSTTNWASNMQFIGTCGLLGLFFWAEFIPEPDLPWWTEPVLWAGGYFCIAGMGMLGSAIRMSEQGRELEYELRQVKAELEKRKRGDTAER